MCSPRVKILGVVGAFGVSSVFPQSEDQDLPVGFPLASLLLIGSQTQT